MSRKIEQNQIKQKEYFDKKRKAAKTYKPGDLVLILKNPNADGSSKKLTPKYAGPMMVTEKLPNDRYRVKDMPGSTRSATKKYDNVAAIDRIRPWIPPGGASDDTSDGSDGDGKLQLTDSSSSTS